MLRMVTSRAGSGVLSEQCKLDGAVAHLGIDAYFQSLVVHKLAHAATDGMICPFEGCLTGVADTGP
jgi:hypothetical protein